MTDTTEIEYSNGQIGHVVHRATQDSGYFIMLSNGEYFVCYQLGSQLNGDDADWCILNDEYGFNTFGDAKAYLQFEMGHAPDEDAALKEAWDNA